MAAKIKKINYQKTKKTHAKKKEITAKPAVPLTKAQQIAGQLDVNLLKRGRVVIVGLGGIGQILANHLTLFLSSMSDHEFRIFYVDGDSFEHDNSYRMDIAEFGNKAEVTHQQLIQKYDRPGLHLRYIPEYVTPKNIHKVVQEGDVVLTGLDNHKSRALINDRVRKLKNCVLISGGNDGVDPAENQQGTYGNVQVYVREKGKDVTAPLDKYHPEIATPADKNPADVSCLELIVSGSAPQLVFANLAAASKMCDAFYRLLKPTDQVIYDEACFDIYEGKASPLYLSS